MNTASHLDQKLEIASGQFPQWSSNSPSICINHSLAESRHAIIRLSKFARKLGKTVQKKVTKNCHGKFKNQGSTDCYVASVGQLNKRWQVREGPAGSRVMGVCAKTRKRYLAGKPGAGAGQEPGQLPTSPTSHCPNFPLPQSHMCRVISCPLLHHIPPLVVLTRLEREAVAPVSLLAIAGCRLPPRSLSGAPASGTSSLPGNRYRLQLRGAQERGQRRLFRHCCCCHRNH